MKSLPRETASLGISSQLGTKLQPVTCSIPGTHAQSATQAKKPTARKANKMLDGIFPWSAPVAGLPVVLSVAVARQYLSGFLIGCGVGGVVGASTLGVAMFSLSAPTGELKNFTAVVPVVNCCANVGTVLQYSKHANRSICMKMWPFIVLGICVGTWLLPRIDEASLRKFTSVVYALVPRRASRSTSSRSNGPKARRRRTTP